MDRSTLEDQFALSFVDSRYIVEPSDSTDRHDPQKVWSKSGSRDPINAEFHPYLKNLGIENWDFDYGKGLVITKASNTNLSVPIEVANHNNDTNSENNAFHLFVRYFKNQKGGHINIHLDGKLINEVDTFDMISNKFVWKNVGAINLTKENEKHSLTLENIDGFNAVNVFAIVPNDEMNRLRAETANLLKDKIQVVYPMEAESNFYNNKGVATGSIHNLFDTRSILDDQDNKNNKFSKSLKGQFKVPANTDLASLQFLTKQNPNTETSYPIKDLKIFPAYKKQNVFTSNFEKKNASAPLGTLRQSDLMNHDKDLLSSSLELNDALDGNASLRVDSRKGWNI
jgi:hypothetical protein